jgi:hypothetical protein
MDLAEVMNANTTSVHMQLSVRGSSSTAEDASRCLRGAVWQGQHSQASSDVTASVVLPAMTSVLKLWSPAYVLTVPLQISMRLMPPSSEQYSHSHALSMACRQRTTRAEEK